MYSYKVQGKSENLNHSKDAHDTFSTSDFFLCVILSILLHLHPSPSCNIFCNLLCFLMFLLFLFLYVTLHCRSVLCSNEFKNTRSTFEIWADEITGLRDFTTYLQYAKVSNVNLNQQSFFRRHLASHHTPTTVNLIGDKKLCNVVSFTVTADTFWTATQELNAPWP